MRPVLVSFTLIYSCMCIIILLYEALHDRPFSDTSEESLRDSEQPDIFLLGTRGPRTGDDFMWSECMKLVLVSLTLFYTYSQLHMD